MLPSDVAVIASVQVRGNRAWQRWSFSVSGRWVSVDERMPSLCHLARHRNQKDQGLAPWSH
jgi:hypothetical protein